MLIVAVADAHVVDVALGLEILDEALKVRCPDADRYTENRVGPDRLADSMQDLDSEPRSILERSAVLVRAQVSIVIEERVDQRVVREHALDTVRAREHHGPCGIRETLGNQANLGGCHRVDTTDT